jgi:mannan endo-1,4-beta-mannosidase
MTFRLNLSNLTIHVISLSARRMAFDQSSIWRKSAVSRLNFFLLLCLLHSGAIAQSIHLEAENAGLRGPNIKAVRPDGPSTVRPAYSGAGYVSGLNTEADMIVFRFKSRAPGIFDLSMSYRAEGKKGYDVTVNGSGLLGILAPTADDSFGKQSLGKVELLAGQNEIIIHRGWGYFDVDSLDLTPAPPPALPIRPSSAASDPNALPIARDLLSRLDNSFGKSTLVGVYKDEDAAYMLATTGVRPAIMGGDLLRYSPQFLIHEPLKSDEVARLISDHEAGMDITLSWHWGSPTGIMDTKDKPWWRGFYADSTNFNVQRAVTDPHSPEYAATISDVHQIAIQLRRLQDAGVPVLWRPLHEAQDQSFWWGAKGPGPFKALWRLLYYQLTEVEGIHNLIWVFTSGGDPEWYPGDSFVDIVGIDAYPKDLHDPQNAMWNTLQTQFVGRKPVTISEFGGIPDIPRMQRYGEWWSYAVSWTDDLGPKKNDAADLKRIVTSPGAQTLPADINGQGEPLPATSPVPAELTTPSSSTPPQ